jgi:hypothetical protein
MPEGIGGVAAAASASQAVGTAPAQSTTQGNTQSPSNGELTGAEGASTKKIDSATPGSSQPEYFDVKVDGKVQKMTREELIQAASLGKAAFKRMEEAGATKRQVEDFISKFRQDPLEALKHPALGLTPEQRRQAIERYYEKEYIQQDKLTPEQKKLQEAEAELNKYREQDQKRVTQEKEAQAKQLQQHYQQDFQKKIIDALDKSGLPKNPKTVARMAFYMQQAARNKFDAPMDVIVGHVRQDYQNDIAEFARSLEGDALVQFLGADTVKKLQRYALSEHKKRINSPIQPKAEPTQPTDKKEKKRSDWGAVNKYWTRNG